ncbi:Transcription factor, CBFA/NFYB, DNA topoisomerase [Corchorus capsularis]|uniref:Transcription factor, CBFA/NFYB, DNA topoisomerase n=1 Tax=Corchorus capsularis TaxID=210143 RepID=A0A1R3HQG8_COCAP|nr:Transcription factor, CBFA/NFYB, DNA topoisomerase [Corchorus capsularis]
MADAPAAPAQAAPASPGGGSHESGEQSPRSNVREQDRYLPIANISRIMKKGLPANGKIAKDAKETVQECVSEFISFITSEASDKCQKEKRKTINGDDLLWAMATLGFEDYIDPLKIYLTRYREGDTKGSAKGGDASAKKEVQPSPNAQLAHQGSFPQGVNYGNSQVISLSLSVHVNYKPKSLHVFFGIDYIPKDCVNLGLIVDLSSWRGLNVLLSSSVMEYGPIFDSIGIGFLLFPVSHCICLP